MFFLACFNALQMVQDGVWAGNIEVQAASVFFGRNVYIYQQGQACWRTVNFLPPEAHASLHLSFHNGDHYNSVRLQSDHLTGLPEPIDLMKCKVHLDKAPTDEVCNSTPGQEIVVLLSLDASRFDEPSTS
jgi:hypothetical protein